MKTFTKVAIGGGALLALWFLLRGTKTGGNADVGASVTKTSSECDPSASNYDASKCTASSDNYNAITDNPAFTPSLPPKQNEPEISPRQGPPGTDGPIVRPLQLLANGGSRIQQPLLGALTSSRRG